ncbi:MAG: hypothetical protein LBQ65_01670 [Tannerellaceae bacterium]|jgi:hypothetical protein|nr:hypothetical protein [Tannerellaceae bacterium]
MNAFFERNQQRLFLLTMLLSGLMSIFLFDVKVSLSGDDCDYLVNADNFWHHFVFPVAHGSFYPIVISPVVGLFGMQLILLKALSAVFILLSIGLFYKSFRGILPAIVLMPSLLLVSVCSYVFFYACHTYSEPLFMLMQGLYVYYFAKYFLRDEQASYHWKTDWRKYLMLGFIALLMGLTRTIGFGVVGVVILFFAIEKRWKDLLYTLTASVLVFFFFQGLKAMLWPEAGPAYDIRNYLSKDYYNFNQGTEDLHGFLVRFIENSHIYLSAFLYQFMGLRPETPSNVLDTSESRTVLTYLLFAVCLLTVWLRRNKALLFAGLYVGVMCFVTFVLLHSFWAQDRLVMIYYPFILLFLLGGICYLFQAKALRSVFVVYPLLLILIGGGTLYITQNRVRRNLPVLQQNLQGNPLYGLTPDWENFIKASQWAAKNLDKDASIVSRKPTISRVYTGREFSGYYHAPTLPIEALDTLTIDANVETLLVADASRGVFPGQAVRYIVYSADRFLFNEGVRKDTDLSCVYLVPNEYVDAFVGVFDQHQMSFTRDFASFRAGCRQSSRIRIYDPDMMRDYLIYTGVDYLLLAKLRTDPRQDTGSYITNVHQFLWYISYKYPDSFRTIHTIGETETCEVVQFLH